MNVTFIIGNGFDINLGMKTRYSDFYKWYIEKDEYFARVIKNHLSNGISTWADLELELGKFTAKLSENDIEMFISEKDRLDISLCEYLRIENQKVGIDYALAGEKLRTCTEKFYKHFDDKYMNEYRNQLKSVFVPIDYKFITLNYTDVLDRICTDALKVLKPELSHKIRDGSDIIDRISKPLYLHGTLNDGMVIGVANKNQIANGKFREDYKCTDYFIKSNLNEKLGKLRIEKAKEIIDNSRYICLFGTSIGETDMLLWHYVASWLMSSVDRRLALFMIDDSIQNESASSIARGQDYYREKFLTVAGVDSKLHRDLHSRIIVCINKQLFNFA